MIQRIEEDKDGPVEVSGRTVLTATITGKLTVLEAAELQLRGEVRGDVVVRRGGALIVTGRIKGAIFNEGGAVDVFGFVGRVEDVGPTQTFVSRGAIIGGKRASRPSKLSTFLDT